MASRCVRRVATGINGRRIGSLLFNFQYDPIIRLSGDECFCVAEKARHFSFAHSGPRGPPSKVLVSSCSSSALTRKCLYSSVALPPHQEIGMPSLSPTMTQGNIASWKKKVGESITAGDVLCEIETDKATLEMDTSEDGFLAKILLPEGAKDIPVGQTIAIVVENEGDIAAFSDYVPGESSASAPSAPSPAKSPPPPPAQPALDLPAYLEIGMPSLSPTMTQGNLAGWKIKVGDAVSAGDVLCEIETDKATLEMETTEDGFVAKILVEDGARDILVGQPIAIIVENEADIPKFASFVPGVAAAAPATPATPAQSAAPAATPSAPSPSPSPPASSSSKVTATPAARRLAAENKVDLSAVKGTGPDGRILKEDIEDWVKKGPSVPEPAAPKAAAAPGVGAGYSLLPEGLNFTDIPNSAIRKVVAKRLLESKQTIPHYYLTVDVQVDQLIELRSKLNKVQEKAKGKKISVNDFVIKASGLALKKVPECNSSWHQDFIRQYHNVDISVAVQTDAGLMVPIVKDADKRGLSSIAEDVKRLAEKARENKLRPEEFQGGTFTISNLGMFGVKSFAAIVNPPQACILAVGAAEVRVIPGAEPGTFTKGTFMTVTLSCDHRVIDGAVGAQWLGAFKGFIEDPVTLML